MNQHTVQQIRGACDLISETVAATVTLIAETHQSIAHQPYALLACLPGCGRPIQAIEQIQSQITQGIYTTILGVNRAVMIATTVACDRLAARALDPASSTHPEP